MGQEASRKLHSPLTYLFLANGSGFLQAAKALMTPIINGQPANGQVLFTNLGFAIELLLKAFLLGTGETPARVRYLGHDLTKARKKALAAGLAGMTDEASSFIDLMSAIHYTHRMRYPTLESLEVTLPADPAEPIRLVYELQDLVVDQLQQRGAVRLVRIEDKTAAGNPEKPPHEGE